MLWNFRWVIGNRLQGCNVLKKCVRVTLHFLSGVTGCQNEILSPAVDITYLKVPEKQRNVR